MGEDIELFSFKINSISLNNIDILTVSAVFILIAAISALVKRFVVLYNVNYTFNAGHYISHFIFERFLEANYQDKIRMDKGFLLSLFSHKVETVLYNLLLPTLYVISNLITIIILLTYLFYTSVLAMFLAFSIIVPAYIFVVMFYKKIMSKNGEDMARTRTKLGSLITGTYESYREVKLESLIFKASNKAFSELDKTLRKSQRSNEMAIQTPKFLVEFLSLIFLITFVLTEVLLGHDVVNLVAKIGVIALALQKIVPLAQSVYTSWVSIQYGQPSVSDVLDWLDERNLNSDILKKNKNLKPLTSQLEKIIFENVSFSYRGAKKTTLNNVSFEINKGDFVLIKGASGSGKSTLLDALLGLLPISDGKIIYNQTNINNLPLDSMEKELSYASQNTIIFNSSIQENIIFNSKRVEQKNLKKSLHDSLAKEVYDKYAKTRSISKEFMSGGESQRIGLARVFYKDRPFIILDEPTSMLDEVTEKRIIENLVKMNQNGKTIVIVTHSQMFDQYSTDIIYL